MRRPGNERSKPYHSRDQIALDPLAVDRIPDEDTIGQKDCPGENQSGRSCHEGQKTDQIEGVPGMERRREEKKSEGDAIESVQELQELLLRLTASAFHSERDGEGQQAGNEQARKDEAGLVSR